MAKNNKASHRISDIFNFIIKAIDKGFFFQMGPCCVQLQFSMPVY